jgi:bifunctional non-homologous end joining protein LigD
MKLEGIVSKRADAPYAPGSRGLWLKVKCLNREEFVVIGWADPEGSRPFLGALLLGYYDPEGRLNYAGRVGTGIDTAELQRLWRRLQPLARTSRPERCVATCRVRSSAKAAIAIANRKRPRPKLRCLKAAC